jgi:hypothetical protein
VHVSVNVFAVAMADDGSLIRVVVLERVVGSKSVGLDGQRLLLVILEKEFHGRFVYGFRRDDVPLSGPSIDEREHRRLVAVVRSPSARGEAPRSRSRPFRPALT